MMIGTGIQERILKIEDDYGPSPGPRRLAPRWRRPRPPGESPKYHILGLCLGRVVSLGDRRRRAFHPKYPGNSLAFSLFRINFLFKCPQQLLKSSCLLVGWLVGRSTFTKKLPLQNFTKLKCWQNSYCDITEIVTKLKLWQNSNCDKAKILTELKLWQTKKIQKNLNQIRTKLKLWEKIELSNNKNCEKLKLWHTKVVIQS